LRGYLKAAPISHTDAQLTAEQFCPFAHARDAMSTAVLFTNKLLTGAVSIIANTNRNLVRGYVHSHAYAGFGTDVFDDVGQ
jgi:hypothetical protein